MSQTDTSDFLGDHEPPSLWYFAGTEEPEMMFAHLQYLWATLSAIREAEADLAERLAAHLPLTGMEIDGEMVEPVSGANRTAWNHEGLKAHVGVAIEQEIQSDPGGNVFDRVFELLWMTASPSWKVRGLRNLNIEASKWCKTTPGRRRVRVVPKAGEQS